MFLIISVFLSVRFRRNRFDWAQECATLRRIDDIYASVEPPRSEEFLSTCRGCCVLCVCGHLPHSLFPVVWSEAVQSQLDTMDLAEAAELNEVSTTLYACVHVIRACV